MSAEAVVRVTVRHNLVCAVERVPAEAHIVVPDSRLEVSTQLARNHQENGCLDGEYYFSDPEQAKTFSLLCLDFARKLTERATTSLENRDFHREQDWFSDSTSSH